MKKDKGLMMQIIELPKENEYNDEIQEIYLEAFPPNESINFKKILARKFLNSKLFALIGGERLIGFSYVCEYKDLVYIIYFAIKKEYRNNGKGSEALNLIDNYYKGKAKVLCVEQPQNSFDLRARRINFYRRNSFNLADFQFECEGESYFAMFSGQFKKAEFLEILKICFPSCKNFKNRET